MGFEATFQFVREFEVEGMFRCLVEGLPPPAGPFALRADAASRWDAAREAILQGDVETAAREACRLVIAWCAASLPGVSLRYLAVTARPLRMEPALEGLPTEGFGPAGSLFTELVRVRPELSRALPRSLDEGLGIGALARLPEDAADALKAFSRGLAPPLRTRLLPLLGVLRAAQRHGLGVLECECLEEPAHDAAGLLCWPGLDRFGLEGPPLSAQEWSRLAHAGLTCEGDLSDLCDRVLEVSPDDRERRSAVLALLARHRHAPWGDALVELARPRPSTEDARRLRRWLEGVLDLETAPEGAWTAYAVVDAWCEDRAPVDAGRLEHGLAQGLGDDDLAAMASLFIPSGARLPEGVGPSLAPAWHAYARVWPELARDRWDSGPFTRVAVRELWVLGEPRPTSRDLWRLRDGLEDLEREVGAEDCAARLFHEAESIARFLVSVLEREPTLDEPVAEVTARILVEVFRSARGGAPSNALVESVSTLWSRLKEQSPDQVEWLIEALSYLPEEVTWADERLPEVFLRDLLAGRPDPTGLTAIDRLIGSAGPGDTSLVRRYRDRLLPLVGPALDDPRSFERVLGALALSGPDAALLPVVEALARDGSSKFLEFVRLVPCDGATATRLTEAMLTWRSRSGERIWDSATEVLRAGHPHALVEALRHLVASGADPAECASAGQGFSSILLTVGGAACALLAVDAVEVVLPVAPERSRANLRYNQACAHALRRDAEAAAASLRLAVALDPT